MEAIRKQASKLREQVARQQQAVLKQFSGRYGHDSALADEAELQCYEELQMLFRSTRAAKHFQREIVRGVEGFISVCSKQMEIVTKLAEDCCKYGNEYQDSGFALAKASLEFGTSHISMEKEMDNLLRILGDQVFDPLRKMITAAPLDDARHLTHRYERIRRDVEAQTNEVLRRQSKSKEVSFNAEDAIKLQNAESRLSELKTALSAMGREATAAMTSVQARQQEVTYQRLLTMVDAERSYHQNVAVILDKLYAEMVLVKQHTESAVPESTNPSKVQAQNAKDPKFTLSGDPPPANGHKTEYFVAKVIHPFDAEADGELSLSVGDYVVVRQVAPNGWSEGECKGKAGWFPSAYIEHQDKAPASKVVEPRLLT
ncbi:SH3 domain-containing protein 2-like [Iris pallida]|uniref:SH3 domain-containing protein 2-like n=1 Tax=Iris pallida TaxID=29817 RepID=A0AAX6DSP0_IRIPA|nr:SH3 domain-containing protein 2-like [Iris pallida]KAJ6825246.1 SH3 domain-containing protein 2-like [Iris pallida]